MTEYVFSEGQRAIFELILHQIQTGQPNKYWLLQGPPGSGKTLFAYHLAKTTGIPFYEITGASIQTPANLFYTYDMAKAKAGTGFYAQSQLWMAIQESKYREVIILFDEADKAPELTDGYLLQVLDTERAFFVDPYGEKVHGDPNNMIFFFTSNGRRSFYEELLRRTRSIYFPAPDKEKILAILQSKGQPIDSLTHYVVRTSLEIRKIVTRPEFWPTPAEIGRLLLDLRGLKALGHTSPAALEEIFKSNFSKNLHPDQWAKLKEDLSTAMKGRIAKAIQTELLR